MTSVAHLDSESVLIQQYSSGSTAGRRDRKSHECFPVGPVEQKDSGTQGCAAGADRRKGHRNVFCNCSVNLDQIEIHRFMVLFIPLLSFLSFPVAKICVVSRTEEVLPAEFCKAFEISDIITQSTVLQDQPEALTPQQLLKHTRTMLPLV